MPDLQRTVRRRGACPPGRASDKLASALCPAPSTHASAQSHVDRHRPATPKPPSTRIASLDQFRGYTVAGMFLVNFLGAYVATPMLLKHHNTFCSYADTIMPQFFFAVGFAFRLTFGRRAQTEGLASAYWPRRAAVARAGAGGAGDLRRAARGRHLADNWSSTAAGRQSLAIALGEDLVPDADAHRRDLALDPAGDPRRPPGAHRLHGRSRPALQVVLSHWFYFDWVQTGGIDGGVLGFLAWTIPTLVGTLACDAVTAADGRPAPDRHGRLGRAC